MHLHESLTVVDVPSWEPSAEAPALDWTLVVYASPRHEPICGAPLTAFADRAPRELDARGLRRRPPRAVVIEAPERGADIQRVLHFLSEAGLTGTTPILIAAPLDVVGELDDVAVDDFVVAPYTITEVAARVRRIARRGRIGDVFIAVGALSLDTAAHRVEVDARPVGLTRLEYALLHFFVEHPGRVFSRDELLARVWGNEASAGSRTVDIHVRRLRAKLGDGIAALETVRGVGYRFMAAARRGRGDA